MKPIVIANWKMNPQSLPEAKKIFGSVKRGIKNLESVEVVICPPFVFLSEIKNLKSKIKIGSQDCFWEESGAFTGEISPSMVKDVGCEYVIIGHSERRKFFSETNETINKKIKEALKIKLKPIFCVGETEQEKKEEKKIEIITSQIKEGLKGVSKKEIKNLTIAYEPVWAIGTGNNCSINETMSSVLFIRKIISQLYNRIVADHLRILYGGSVNGKNATEYVRESGINGFLVGGASLRAEEFIKIVKSSV